MAVEAVIRLRLSWPTAWRSIRYALRLSGYGDAAMINIFDEEGRRIEPYAAKKSSVGQELTTLAKSLRCTHVIPFSSFHQYQREDSIWAEKYTTSSEFDRTIYRFLKKI